ncbi:pentapeptide repeat-containing protein [Nocardia sp. NPDC051030]|uniref:pentapeptide repeat-containing protein n=1 Tax=Nocardia sp. NPDC051030 TaxID=3155162 RepID=UPI003439608D
MPRALADLPYSHHLQPFDGELEPDQDYDAIHVAGRQLDEIDGRGVRFNESAVTDVTVSGGTFRYARFTDVWMRGVRWVGTNIGQSGWQDAELIDSALSGIEAVGSELRRVRFESCKFESVNFRNATLHDVEFADCVLRDVDFGEAKLQRLRFPGSTVERLALHRARLKDIDLRGAVRLDVASGVDALRGATISTAQLMDLAPIFAHAAGIIVRDN